MRLKNIELFDRFVPYIAADLYEAFPVCKDLNTAAILAKHEAKSIELDEKKKELILSETIFWLRENGFLEFEAPAHREGTNVAYPMFWCVRLTAKGINILNSTPTALTNSERLGEKIVKAATKSFIEGAPDVVVELLKKIGGY